MKQLSTLILLVCSLQLSAQIYDDYIGAGQSQGVTFTSSDSQSNGLAAMNGSGLNLDMRGSSRFLAHATMGFTIEDVQLVTETGIEAWIDNQMALPASEYATTTVEFTFGLLDQCYENFSEEYCEQNFIPNAGFWRVPWWNHVMKSDDQLRQRVALALSEILVISDQSELQNAPQGMAAYYDILASNAFGNYRDILQEITLNPSMGFYLSHINNPRTIPLQNTRPDEFPFQAYDLLQPMRMYEIWHEPGEKTIVGDYVIPAGQSGMEDINEALDVLFHHDNVGPFLARRLIQRLIKSNPTPAYIDRVASTFNDNGNGVRGDMEAVIKAILLDAEAYECFWMDNPLNGMLRSPLLRYTQMMKGLKVESDTEIFFNAGGLYEDFAGQAPLSAPSVFNFYSPDYVPNADFAYDNLVGPEYQILNSFSSSNYVNYMLLAFMKDYVNDRFSLTGTDKEFRNVLNGNYGIYNRFDPENNEDYAARFGDELWMDLGYAPADLIDYLDILMCNGSLSDDTRERLTNSVSRTDLFTPIDAAHYAAYMIMINPDYTILK